MTELTLAIEHVYHIFSFVFVLSGVACLLFSAWKAHIMFCVAFFFPPQNNLFRLIQYSLFLVLCPYSLCSNSQTMFLLKWINSLSQFLGFVCVGLRYFFVLFRSCGNNMDKFTMRTTCTTKYGYKLNTWNTQKEFLLRITNYIGASFGKCQAKAP